MKGEKNPLQPLSLCHPLSCVSLSSKGMFFCYLSLTPLTLKSIFKKTKHFPDRFTCRLQRKTHKIDFKYIYFLFLVIFLYIRFFFFSQETALQPNNQNQVTHTQAHYTTYPRQSTQGKCLHNVLRGGDTPSLRALLTPTEHITHKKDGFC